MTSSSVNKIVCISGDQANLWRSIITQFHEKYMSNGYFKFVQINMKHLLYIIYMANYKLNHSKLNFQVHKD